MSRAVCICPYCESSIRMRAEDEGRWIRCPECREEVELVPERPRRDSVRSNRRRPSARRETSPRSASRDRRRSDRRDRQRKQSSSSRKGLWIGIGSTAGVAIIALIVVLITTSADNAATDLGYPKSTTKQNSSPFGNALANQNTNQQDRSSNQGTFNPNNGDTGYRAPVGPPIPLSAGATKPVKEPVVKYNWKNRREHPNLIEIEADLGNEIEKITGHCVYTLDDSPLQAILPSLGGNEGTGSGFVVSTDGYMVTCAHVIEGASEIEVALAARPTPHL